MGKGTIANPRGYKWATCGKCNNQEVVTPPGYNPTQQQFAAEARRMGWQNTRVHGWICPHCADKGAQQ